MKRLCFALLVTFSSMATSFALAQTYPDRTIRIVVPYAAGGAASVYANLISGRLSEIVKQPVVVENRPGAGGNVGSDFVAKSPPDGYTVLLHTSALASAGPLYRSLPFDPVKDLAPVTNVVHTQMILAGSLKSPALTLSDLITEAKAKPGRLNYGSSGLGSALHLFGEIFKSSAGVDLLHIPYRGDAPVMTALIAGDVQIAFLPQASAQAAVEGGSVRALAVTGLKRFPQLPDTPTLHELGIEGFEGGSWTGMWMPAGTSPEVVLAFQQRIAQVLADPMVAERFRSIGAEPSSNSPVQFATQFNVDAARYADIIKKAKIPKLD